MLHAAHDLTNRANLFPLKVGFLALALTAVPVLAGAQDTREEHLAAIKAEKAAALRPYEPTDLERHIETVQRLDGVIFGGKTGLYSFVGTTFDGGGLAAGPGYRNRYRDSGTLDVHGAWSVKNYKALDAAVALPMFLDERVKVEMRANWLDAPSVAFFGTGQTSRKDARTDYAFRTASAGVMTRVEAAPHFALGGGFDQMRIETSASALLAPGADADPGYRRTNAFAELDWRTSPGYTTRGGLYRLDWSKYSQTNGSGYNFDRVDAEVQQFVPILHESWVIALRALASSTNPSSGAEVPYFLMPDLGGSHTLRGYPAWRFRDRNRLLLTGEYRWTAGSLVDMAVFIDAGKVTSRTRDLDLTGLTKTYGLGMTFHTPVSTLTRIEVARTSEGTSLVFSFSPSF